MKKILLLLLASLLLSSCGEQDSGILNPSSVLSVGSFRVEKANFTIDIPQNWQEVSGTEFFGKSFSGAVSGSFRALQSEEGIFPNVVVTTEKIPRNFSALEFSESLMENTAGQLFGFSWIGETPVTIAGQPSRIVEFLGSSSAETPPMRFWQIAFVRDGVGVVATGGAAENAKNAPQTIIEILKTLK